METGVIMQGSTISSLCAFATSFHLLITQLNLPNTGVSAKPRCDHESVTKNETKLSFCMCLFSLTPSFFHYQINTARWTQNAFGSNL